MMDKQIAERLKNQPVKVSTKFICTFGEIIEVHDNCIIFKSNKGISAISLESIDTIMLCGGGEKRG